MNRSEDSSINPGFNLKRVKELSVDDFAHRIRSGDRASLSRAITLIESSKPEFREKGEKVIEKLLPYTGGSLRIAITGVPGAGKSTFIEALGEYLISEKKKRVAVLAIDPSSSLSGGSILGDKTRMPALSVNKDAYVRPSPSAGTLGGVARKTREAMLLCEAAGYDLVFIETVGVGQSETTVKQMTDFFLLLMIAGAGDELQGIKRGIMEMADLIAVNKADGDNLPAAERAASELKRALSFMPEHPVVGKVPVLTCSSQNRTGLEVIWEEIMRWQEKSERSGFFEKNREEQVLYWLHETIQGLLLTKFLENEGIQKRISEIENRVASGSVNPFTAAAELAGAVQVILNER